MAEIQQPLPTYRIPPTRPGARPGQGNQAPQKQPKNDDRQHDQRRQRKKDGDDGPRIDEYA
ncbi:hypothetical protein [Thiogranum longum]|jgi:hypothetical protein